MIAIVDLGVGNLHSVEAGLRRAGATARIVSTAADLQQAQKIVLPGDGHFGATMEAIDNRDLRAALLRAAAQKPFLGICIGMQVLYQNSDEADRPGLGLLPGQIKKLPAAAGKIPHIGWNTVNLLRPHALLCGIPQQARFYFVHSYFAGRTAATIATTEYGAEIAAVAAQQNICATQFHPEKSARWGAQLLQNFAAL